MQPDNNSSVIARLRSAEGHLKAVTTMVENGKTGDQVLHQLNAVQRGLCAITQLVLTEHLQESESIIKFSEHPQERAQALDYLTMLYQWTFDHK
jgi:DNA-binding FrmR family transcriptional regulator